MIELYICFSVHNDFYHLTLLVNISCQSHAPVVVIVDHVMVCFGLSCPLHSRLMLILTLIYLKLIVELYAVITLLV